MMQAQSSVADHLPPVRQHRTTYSAPQLSIFWLITLASWQLNEPDVNVLAAGGIDHLDGRQAGD